MKPFFPTYLYIKTHNKTGLKYFGKTTNDPHRYYGSGKYWLSHLRKHGYDISTEIIGYYTSKEECQNAAENFSIINNIVESKEWANLILENGLNGGNTNRTVYLPHTDESKRKMSNTLKGRIPWNKGVPGSTPGNRQPRSEKTKELLSKANLGKKQSQETIEKRRSKMFGRAVTAETREKISNAQKGKIISEETLEKMRAVVRTEEQKLHLRNINLGKKASKETKEKLSGYVVVVDKSGEVSRISKEQYYSQVGPKNEWEWISHRSAEGMARKSISKMRRG